MALQARDRMIEAFTNDPSVTVFLMSLKAGGVALNLTAASHVMLMDPWWNPSVEFQVGIGACTGGLASCGCGCHDWGLDVRCQPWAEQISL